MKEIKGTYEGLPCPWLQNYKPMMQAQNDKYDQHWKEAIYLQDWWSEAEGEAPSDM